MGEEPDRCPEFTYKLTGLAIREYLLHVGEGYPYEFYKCFKKVKPSTSYDSVKRYFFFLRKLGLIEVVRVEPRRTPEGKTYGIPRTYYRIVPGAEGDHRWFAPQAEYYPQTRLGAKRYVPKYKAGGGSEE